MTNQIKAINSKKTLIISDIHLKNDGELFAEFTQNHTKNVDEIYILGDLFNLYLGDDLIKPHYQKIVNLLKTLSKTTKIFIMTGNKDFLLGDEFAKKSGAKLINEPYILDNFVLIHGDSLVTDDKKYQWFKKVIQSKFVKFILLKLSKKLRAKIADKIQIASQKSKKNKSAAIMDVNQKSVLNFMQKYPNKHLIHGHTHKQNTHIHNSFKRYVLGDWHKNSGNFLQIADGEITFIEFCL